MSLYIRDDQTAALVARLATERGISKTEAVRQAVTAALKQAHDAVPMHERVQAWRAAHPFPPPTGLAADKAFFDDLSGES